MRGVRRAWSVVLGAAVLGLGALVPAELTAGLVPGSGTAKSNCYVELDVQDVDDAMVMEGKRIACTDGDGCDQGPCGDGECTFGVRVCWNQEDPAVPGCVPPDSLQSLRTQGTPPALSLPGTFEGSSCTGSFVDVTVSTKRNGTKSGKEDLKLTGKAPKGTRPRTDRDSFVFVCQPRIASCSTTTTAAPTTTTSSTAPNPSTTTSTAAPTTTTTHGKPTTTTSPTTTTTHSKPTTTTSTTTTTTTVLVSTTTIQATTTSTTATTTSSTETTTSSTDTTTSSTDTTTSSTETTTSSTDTTTSSTDTTTSSTDTTTSSTDTTTSSTETTTSSTETTTSSTETTTSSTETTTSSTDTTTSTTDTTSTTLI